MTNRHVRFMACRRWAVRRGREIVGIAALLIGWIAFWLWWRVPLLVNPWMVSEGVLQQKLTGRTLGVMAMLLPVFVLLTIGLVALLVALVWAWLRLERRYLELLDDTTSPAP